MKAKNQLLKLKTMIAAFDVYFAKCFLIQGKLKEKLDHYQIDIEDNLAQDLKYFNREIDVLIQDIANYKIYEVSQSLNIFKNYKTRIQNYIKIGQKQNPKAIEFKNLLVFSKSLNDLINFCESFLSQ